MRQQRDVANAARAQPATRARQGRGQLLVRQPSRGTLKDDRNAYPASRLAISGSRNVVSNWCWAATGPPRTLAASIDGTSTSTGRVLEQDIRRRRILEHPPAVESTLVYFQRVQSRVGQHRGRPLGGHGHEIHPVVLEPCTGSITCNDCGTSADPRRRVRTEGDLGAPALPTTSVSQQRTEGGASAKDMRLVGFAVHVE